jgi:exopolysaccharide production protein ExoQ
MSIDRAAGQSPAGPRPSRLGMAGGRPSALLDRKRRIEPIESALAVIAILVTISTFRALLLSGGEDSNEAGSLLNQVVTFGFSAAGIGILALYGLPVWLVAVLRRSWPILLFSALAVASVLWSLDPGATLRRGMALVLFTGFLIYLTARFSSAEMLDRLLIAFVIFVAVGYLAVLIPGQGITPDGILAGTWRGLTGQKNEFGRACAIIMAIAVIAVVLRRGQFQMAWIGVAVFALPLLVMSGSKTPLAAVFAALGLTLLVKTLSSRRIGSLMIGGSLAATTAIAVLMALVLTVGVILPLVLELLGRDLTFSGRLSLWNYVLARSEDRQLLGSGFRAFWSETNRLFYFEHFRYRIEGETRIPFHSHSGFLDMRAELGWIGVGLLVVVLASTMRTIHRGFAAGLTLSPSLLCMMFVFTIVFSVTERSFLQYFDTIWFFYLLFYFIAKRELHFADQRGSALVRP